MRLRSFFSILAGLLAFVASPALAQLPYNPTRILSTSNGSLTYIFAPGPSAAQFSLSLFNTSSVINASYHPLTTLYSTLPFLSSSSSKAFIPIIDDQGDITVLAGDCREGAQGLELWRFSPTIETNSGEWSSLQLTLVDPTLSANFLSAGFSFSPTDSLSDASVYVFGGMCPQTESSSASDWTLDATYSNTMLTISADLTSSQTPKNTPYDLSMTGSRAPPIAEAGLTITPLMPTFANTSDGNVSQQQNFVLIGGHTQNAFINMSQVALFSLPEDSWAFLGIDQPAGTGGSTELFARDSSDEVEPRSGHTAVMTPDGSRIVVFGGWVGDISTPASPQLAILEVGQGYGGSGDWAWTIPSQNSNPFPSGQGVYGHGATILPGGVMMIVGGYTISASGSKQRRASSQTTNSQILFFNTTSSSWVSSYTNPASPESPAYVGGPPKSSTSLKAPAQKAGLGVGLALGLIAVAVIVVFWLLYRRRLRQKRAVRERELRELALGAERYHSGALVGPGMDGRGGYPEMRTASWGDRQERRIQSGPNDAFPWAPTISQDQAGKLGVESGEGQDDIGIRHSEENGLSMEIPSPIRGMRRSLHSSGPTGFGANFGPFPGRAPNSVFRIDEEEEGSQVGSLKGAKTPARDAMKRSSALSDPFRDPPTAIAPETQADPAAEERKREVQGWVDDWSAAAETMATSRNPSKATIQGRGNSNLSYSQSNSHSGSSQSGRGSPDKSDRTGSNLSERSVRSDSSLQRSITGTVSRNVSTRSASAGYALFADAAAAMAARVSGGGSRTTPRAEYGTVNTGRGSISRAPSKRSTSLNLNSTSSSQGYTDRSETFSTARTSLGAIQPGEDHSLLNARNSRAIADEKDYWATPPESPVKERNVYVRTNSFGSQAGRKALGLLGSVKRVFTGTGNVDVQDRVAELEGRTAQSSPTKHSDQPSMMEVGPRRTVSANAAFWRGKRGAKDWDEDDGGLGQENYGTVGVGSSYTVRRKALPGHSRDVSGSSQMHHDLSDSEDWDVETAIQRRVVQVMFTVPKEKLRVVNADALSLMSKSDVDFEGGENDGGRASSEVKRMSSVREATEEEQERYPDQDQMLDMLRDGDDDDDDGDLLDAVLGAGKGCTPSQSRTQSPQRDKGKGRSKYVFEN